jgi:excisionase family DNA binding protein
MLPRLLNSDDIATILNISKSMAYRLMRRGDIATIHLGHSVRVRPEDLEAFVSSRREEFKPYPKIGSYLQ